MNFKFCTIFAASAIIMASCSSEEPAAVNPEIGGDQYLALTVNLPSDNGGSRAVSYEDGVAQEYKVDNGTLLVFKKAGSSEADYTFVESANLGGLAPWNAESDAQVTTSATAVAKLSARVSVTNSDEYYGLVLLNNPTTGGISNPSTGETFGSWLNRAQSPAIGNTLFMASAPRYTSNSTPLTLVKLDKSKIASSEATATEIGATIYVERGVAKVTVTEASMNSKNVSGSTYAGDKVTLTKWALDVTNRSTFPVRNLTGLQSSFADIWSNSGSAAPATTRFVGGNNTFMRVHWGIDPNYSTDFTDLSAIQGAFNVLTEAQLDASNNVGKAVYCLENTFDVNHMVQGQTTRVVFKADYTPNGMTAGTTFFRIGSQSTIWSQANLVTFLKAKAAEAFSVSADKVAVNLSSAITSQAGNHPLTKDQITLNGTALTDAQLTQLLAFIGAADGINTYLNGKCYYIARIKHFGDAETPWTLGDPTYDGNNLKYLGRYSVVRNNWYELNVGSISNPGYAVIPPINPLVPDDETDLYISVSVKILPWAKRVQVVDL